MFIKDTSDVLLSAWHAMLSRRTQIELTEIAPWLSSSLLLTTSCVGSRGVVKCKLTEPQ